MSSEYKFIQDNRALSRSFPKEKKEVRIPVLVFDHNKFQEIRIARRMTLQRLARITGLTPTGVWLIERGRRKPSADTLGLLASGLGCRIDDFYSTKSFHEMD